MELKLVGEDKAELSLSTVSCSVRTACATVRQLSSPGEGIMRDLHGELGHYVERERGGDEGQRPKLIGNQASLTPLFPNKVVYLLAEPLQRKTMAYKGAGQLETHLSLCRRRALQCGRVESCAC